LNKIHGKMLHNNGELIVRRSHNGT